MKPIPITLKAAPDFSKLPLIQSKTGHVLSPWFTFHKSIHGNGDGLHLRDQRIILMDVTDGFCARLSLKPEDVILTVRPENEIDDSWFRIATDKPCALPHDNPLAAA